MLSQSRMRQKGIWIINKPDVLDTLRDDNDTHRDTMIHPFPELTDTDLHRNFFHSSERVPSLSDLVLERLPSNSSTLDKDRRQTVLPCHKIAGFQLTKTCPQMLFGVTNNTKNAQDIHDD
jgi:hypothetical protein